MHPEKNKSFLQKWSGIKLYLSNVFPIQKCEIALERQIPKLNNPVNTAIPADYCIYYSGESLVIIYEESS